MCWTKVVSSVIIIALFLACIVSAFPQHDEKHEQDQATAEAKHVYHKILVTKPKIIHKHHFKKIPVYKILKIPIVKEVKIPVPVKVPVKVPYPIVIHKKHDQHGSDDDHVSKEDYGHEFAAMMSGFDFGGQDFGHNFDFGHFHHHHLEQADHHIPEDTGFNPYSTSKNYYDETHENQEDDFVEHQQSSEDQHESPETESHDEYADSHE